MKINKKHLLYIILILTSSCKNKTTYESNLVNKIDTTFICDLNENIEIINQIDDAKFINDSTFIIISNKQIIKYDIKGNQLNIINNVGQAPHEYIMPSLIDICDSSIFIWCDTSLKLLEYDFKGKFINAITNYREAIKNFKVYKNKFIFFYKNNGTKEGVIDVYDIEKKEIIKAIGTYTDEDLLLSMLKFKPEIIILEEYIYFIRPSSLNIYRFNINNFDLEIFSSIKDNEFSINKIGRDAATLINTKRERAFEYIYNNSLTNNIFLIEEGLILKAETGNYKVDKKGININSRFNKFYLSKDDQNSGIWKTPLEQNYYNYINYNYGIYIIYNTLYNETIPSKLFKINFHCS